MRFGFAAYLHPGLLIDHVVAEAWDEAAGRWRLIDGEMSSNWTPEVDGRLVDWMDLADDQFVTGPRAWQAARAGTSDPERHLTSPTWTRRSCVAGPSSRATSSTTWSR